MYILVLIGDSFDPLEVTPSLSKVSFDIVLENGEFDSVVVLSEGLFEDCSYPLIPNLKKEGV